MVTHVHHVIEELGNIVFTFEEQLNLLGETSSFAEKPLPTKWSRKEVLGHLIDSAHNNLRRFIVAQYEEVPHIVYNQDFWVTANNYQEVPTKELIAMWSGLNLSILRVLQQMPASHYERLCNTGKVAEENHSLLWLAEDYVKHLKHHLNQIVPRSFDISYP